MQDPGIGGPATSPAGIARIEERTAKRVVTTGCGQGSVFGGLMEEVDSLRLPEARLDLSQLTYEINGRTYTIAGNELGATLMNTLARAPAGFTLGGVQPL